MGDRVGRIAAGYWFDAIVVDDDPSDLAFARHGRVHGVFKAGEAVVAHPRLEAAAEAVRTGGAAEEGSDTR
jgi:cytosine/adenosine deaminase-related metal-dependent hydrolase